MVAPWVLEMCSSHKAEFRLCLTYWLIRGKNQTQSIVDACLLLLEESYLLLLPLPPRAVLPAVPGPRNFRFLFRRRVASLLGWTERREEGEYHGFIDSVNKFVREIWWPDEGAEALHDPRQGNRQSSASEAPQVIPPVPDVRATSDAGKQLRRCEVGSIEDVSRKFVPRSAPCGEVRGRPPTMQHQPHTNTGVEGGSNIIPEAAFDEQLLLRSSDFPAGRLVRQRLELGAGGNVLLHQSVEGLLAPTQHKEGTSEVAPQELTSPVRAAKKKPARKRRTAFSDDEGAPMDLLLEALRDDSICNLDSIATSNFELMWASSSLPTSTRNVILRSDSYKNLLTPLYDLGCLGRSCIVPRSELLDLIIPSV